MTYYVLVYVEKSWVNEEFLVINKNKPDWQKGKKNLPGGKIEDGETALEAAERELKEESNLRVHSSSGRLLGKITNNDNFVVYCVSYSTWDSNIVSLTDEKVEWLSFDNLDFDSSIIENLKIVVPLMRSGISGWTLIAEKGGVKDDSYEVIFDG